MTKLSLCTVRIAKNDWDSLQDSLDWKSGNFRHVVGSTNFSASWIVALVLVKSHVVAAALVRRYGHPGAVQDGLQFKNLAMFSKSVRWSEIVKSVPAGVKRYVDRMDGEEFPEKTLREIETALNGLIPGGQRIIEDLRIRIERHVASSDAETTVFEQRDATALGLEIGGLDSRQLLKMTSFDTSVPFLSGLKANRISEAASIRYDSAVFEDWPEAGRPSFDIAQFQDPDDPRRKMTILYADKEDLERKTGTDLIYYRHHRPGFILVQYKRMRRVDNIYTYFPDKQLEIEMDRMKKFPASVANSVADWRLSQDAFFVKLVRDDMVKPTENKLVQGMYIPISLADLLLVEGRRGDRNKGWSSKDLSQYLSNAEFLLLAKQGFIGTGSAGTRHLHEVIRNSLDGRRRTVIAFDDTRPDDALRLRHG